MASYSSGDFYRNWRYAVETEFSNANGTPFVFAEDGKRTWGDELKSIKFDSSPKRAAINDDRTLIAISTGNDIHLCNADFEPISILQGHTSQMDGIAFQPGQPRTLVSCAVRDEPTINFWNLKGQNSQRRSISGRLGSSFQSNIFSPTGKFMIYMPGNRPESNGDDQWDIKICTLQEHEHEDIITLSGHRDAIMWAGYDTSEELIGTAAWDRTFRIWDAKTGREKYKFQTNTQNWSAGFSPDSNLFAGTSGDGKVHVYSLNEGSKLFQLDLGHWCRALDWAPDGKTLVVGEEFRGKMCLIDVAKKEIVQKRSLSTAKVRIDNEALRGLVDRSLGVSVVKFADQGRKLIFWTYGDASAEAYDLTAGTKWRFAREGTESYEDDQGRVEIQTVKGGNDMLVWEDHAKGRIMIATLDYDAVRIWSLEMDSNNGASAVGS